MSHVTKGAFISSRQARSNALTLPRSAKFIIKNNPQAPVDVQLAVTLYCMGCFGNDASLEDLARTAGCSEGAVELYTDCCFQAIESLHDIFVCPLTPEEKGKEKEWMDEQLAF